MGGLAAALGVGAVAAGVAIQHFMGLEPCPLCIFQRVAFLAAAAPSAAGAVWSAIRGGAKPAKVLLVLGAFLASCGLAIAVRHMYVIWVPQDTACGPDLDYMMESFPVGKWLPKVFAGEAECSAAGRQTFLLLPIPVWSALLFVGQAVAAARGAFGCRPRA